MTAQDQFQAWEAKAKNMTIEGLQYSIRDCKEAAMCARGFDAIAEGRYLDEMGAYITELNARTR